MAMESRHGDSDGSDIFWPGYVDAVTNLVLNLLFLLTIMTVAVFMFALELGRMSKIKVDKPPVVSKEIQKKTVPESKDAVKENVELRREIERLNMQIAQLASMRQEPSTPDGGPVKTLDATSSVAKPRNGIDKTAVNDFEIVVRFADEAVAFTAAEHDHLLDVLRPVAERGKANINVEVPVGFSEAKRMAFYRAMAVRNMLLEMNVPKDRIDVSVHEVKTRANASLVKVRTN